MAHVERRQAPRRQPEAQDPAARVRLRAGRELRVVDVSSSGLWVEGAARLLPGTHVDIHVFTPHGRVLTRTRVARACVGALSADAVLYRAALCFERPLDLAGAGYALPIPEDEPVAGEGMVYPDSPPSSKVRAEIGHADTRTTREPEVASRLVEAAWTISSGAEDDHT